MRRTESLRRLVRETQLAPAQLVLPLFVRPGRGIRQPVGSMPGVCQTSVDEMLRDAREAERLGIGGVLLFGIPDAKDAVGLRRLGRPRAGAGGGARAQARAAAPRRDHRRLHVRVHRPRALRRPAATASVDNDATLELLAKEALSHARAGADIVAPSDMMDGRVGAIRAALDADGFPNTPILSYAAKFASGSTARFARRRRSTPPVRRPRGYQMDSANVDEALREVWLDIEEGADMVMVEAGGAVSRRHSPREGRDRAIPSPRIR